MSLFSDRMSVNDDDTLPDPRDDNIVVVDGTIGVGKTNLVRELAKELNRRGVPTVAIPESMDKWMLDLFYSDTARYAYIFQMEVFHGRWVSVMKARELVGQGKFVVMDTDPRRDIIFAYANLDFDTMNEYLVAARGYIRRYDFVPRARLNLMASVDICLGRIRSRDRVCERTISKSYLETLDSSFKIHSRAMRPAAHEIKLDWNAFGSAKSVVNDNPSIFTHHHIC